MSERDLPDEVEAALLFSSGRKDIKVEYNIGGMKWSSQVGEDDKGYFVRYVFEDETHSNIVLAGFPAIRQDDGSFKVYSDDFAT